VFDGADAGDLMPWAAVIVLGVVLTGAGVLLVVVGSRAAAGRLPRNWIVGIRTTKTLESAAAWQAAHHAAAGSFSVAGYVAVMGGLALFTRPSNIVGLGLVVLVLLVMLAAALIGAYRGFRAIDDL
jgi:uncharacterized membrane protein